MISGEETIETIAASLMKKPPTPTCSGHRQLRLSSQISEHWPMLGEFGILPETPKSVGEREDNVW